eukprot:CAMPEP_0181434694 /NCGR_PEP_ID=MMETSP1110-20121109/19949_1 /TAXON_ID=174948 /ORGANISM="Symbiodinium sp., Strain CCMP421" /LENGTH=86 /DNA_ID=CAMNT_0023558205 /DNA_START=1279 /DNA_END=1539 /DNA_ORIENTATION=-
MRASRVQTRCTTPAKVSESCGLALGGANACKQKIPAASDNHAAPRVRGTQASPLLLNSKNIAPDRHDAANVARCSRCLQLSGSAKP